MPNSKRKTPRDHAHDVIGALKAGERQILVVLVVPSHDRHQEELNNQDVWVDTAMQFVGELFGGATAFDARAGVFKSVTGRLLHDKPVLLETYVTIEVVLDVERLTRLYEFAERLRRETSQESVMVVVDDVVRFVE